MLELALLSRRRSVSLSRGVRLPELLTSNPSGRTMLDVPPVVYPEIVESVGKHEHPAAARADEYTLPPHVST